MRRHELELIAALAEGSLDDESTARALIESSPDHRAEYEAQKAAIEAMRSVQPAQLTEHERSALHRDVWTELQATPARAAKTPWYYRWAYVTAGFLVIAVGLGTVLSGGDDDAETARFTEVASGLGQGDDGATAQTTESASTEQSDETVAEDSADSAALSPADPLVSFFLERAQSVRDGDLSVFAFTDGSSYERTAEDHASCLENLDLEGYDVIALISVEEAREFGLEAEAPYLVAVPAVKDIEARLPVAFIESETCALVHLDE